MRFVKILNNLECPDQLKGIFKLRSTLLERQLREKILLDLSIVRTKIGQSMFKYAGAKDWNLLPKFMREIISINCFKQTLFNYLLESDSSSHSVFFPFFFFTLL